MVTDKIPDYAIQALVDDELDWQEEMRIKELLKDDEDARLRYQELMQQKQLLKNWWNSLYKH